MSQNQPMLTLIDLLRRSRERIHRGWTQHAPARTASGTMCGASDPAAVAWCAAGAAWYADNSIPDCLNDPCYRLQPVCRRSVPGRGLRQTRERLEGSASPGPGPTSCGRTMSRSRAWPPLRDHQPPESHQHADHLPSRPRDRDPAA